MRPVFMLFLTMLGLGWAVAEDSPTTEVRLLYIDRPPTPREVSDAESAGTPLEPTIYVPAPAKEGKPPEYAPLTLPFSRFTDVIRLPVGTPLTLYSQPAPASKFAEIPLTTADAVFLVLRASRDKQFRDAALQLVSVMEKDFPWGGMLVINTTAKTMAVRASGETKEVPAGGFLVMTPKRGRRDVVPVLVGVRDKDGWREVHSGATRLGDNARVTLLVSAQEDHYSAEYLMDLKPESTATR